MKWGLLRKLAILRNKSINDGKLVCVDCGKSSKRIYDVHHEAYPESENYYMDDCCSKHVVLCRECHEIRHGKVKDDMMLKEYKLPENYFLLSHFAFLFYNELFVDEYYKCITDSNINISANYCNMLIIIKDHINTHELKDVTLERLNKIGLSDAEFKYFSDSLAQVKKQRDLFVENVKKYNNIPESSNNQMQQLVNESNALELESEIDKHMDNMREVFESMKRTLKKKFGK